MNSELTPQEALRRFAAEQFSPSYLLYGEEPFFVDQVLRALRAKKGTEGDWTSDDLDGRKMSPEEIVLHARRCLLTGGQRVLVIRNTDKMSDPQERLISYLQTPSPTTVMVFIATKPDMRTKFFAQLKQHVTLIRCRPLYDNEVPRFIREEAARQNIRLTDESLWRLQESAGNNLYGIQRELEKIALMTPTLSSLQSQQDWMTPFREHSVFELMAAIEKKDMERGLFLLSALLSEGEAPLMIVAMLLRHFRMMIIAKEQLQTISESEVRKTLSIPPSRVGSFLQSLGVWTSIELQKAFDVFREVDDNLKRGGVAFIVLEPLVMRLCQAAPSDSR